MNRLKTADPMARVDVLIVDGDEEIRMLAAYSVQQMGYRVVEVSNAGEALEALGRCTPRVMITDAQFCQSVKAAHPDVKLIMMTKPIDFHHLHRVLVRLAPKVAA
jgi:DNA-binding NtrC family response regulator